jgi:hypothetical protein
MALYGYSRPTPEPLPQAGRHLAVNSERGWHYPTYAERAANVTRDLARTAPLGSRADEQLADSIIRKIQLDPANTGAVALGEQLARTLASDHSHPWRSGETHQQPGTQFSHDHYPTTTLHQVPAPTHIPNASADFGHYHTPAA